MNLYLINSKKRMLYLLVQLFLAIREIFIDFLKLEQNALVFSERDDYSRGGRSVPLALLDLQVRFKIQITLG